MTTLSYEEFVKMTVELEGHHPIFASMWNLGHPDMSESVSTACVCFNEDGQCISFKFNPNFFDALNHYSRKFVWCHEILHVLLRHGERGRASGVDQQVVNTAMDVVVNHMLVDSFGFEREELNIPFELCWIDTVFEDPSAIERGRSFEYYYNQIIEHGSRRLPTLDSHESLKDIPQEATMRAGDNLSNEERTTFNNATAAEVKTILDIKPPIKRKWEEVIYDWYQSKMEWIFAEEETWQQRSERFNALPDDYMLPGKRTNWVLNTKKEKIKVVFYVDSSGSCWSLAPRFIAAARTLPPEFFDVQCFSFDTWVYPVDLENPSVQGGGGTSFKCLDKHLRKLEQQPEAVFVVTDGLGDHITPIEPEKWHWFLSRDTRYCIPSGSRIFVLAEFE
jgi:hypothetical protein